MLKENKNLKLGSGFIISLLALLFVFLLYMSGLFDRLELSAYDLRFKSIPTQTVDPAIKIIAIDDKSLKDIGRWPFRRKIHAELINILSEHGAKAIMFDVLFIEPDNNFPEDDIYFKEAIKNAGNVYLPMYFPSENQGEIQPPDNILKKNGFKSDIEGIFRADTAVSPLNILLKGVKGSGYVNGFPDEDGVTRSVVLLIRYMDRLYPLLSFRMALDYLNISFNEISITPGDNIKLDNKKIPIDEYACMKINFPGDSYSFDSYSFSDVINSYKTDDPQIDLKIFNDKVVFIGLSAAGSTDLGSTPLGRTEPMLTIHASIFNNIIRANFIRESSKLQDILTLIILSFIMGLFLPRMRPIGGIVFTLSIFILYLSLNFFIFYLFGFSILIVYPVILLFTADLSILIYKYAKEEKEKKWIKNVFSTYMTPSVVQKILKDPNSLKLGGERKEMTVFFSDLAGFTTISENLSPEELVHLINEYLDAMTTIIFRNEGTLDKYEGDAIMAFWNAPLEQERHAYLCCKTAIECYEELKRLQKKWIKEGRPPLDMRIGINTGQMIVGNMGSTTRMDYTVMGDAVNLGARLESANKAYGTKIMMSEFTKEHVEEFIEFRELDALKVKGKNKPVYVYEVMALKDSMDPKITKGILSYNEGLRLYKSKNWDEAITNFKAVLTNIEKDPPSLTYIERCTLYKKTPPPKDWNGVWELKSK